MQTSEIRLEVLKLVMERAQKEDATKSIELIIEEAEELHQYIIKPLEQNIQPGYSERKAARF